MALEDLEKAIQRFEEAQEGLREEVRNAHAATKALKEERKEAEKLIKESLKSIETRIIKEVEKNFEQMQKEFAVETHRLYERVQRQVDILIDIALGKRSTRSGDKKDIRPALAAKMREWIMEELLLEIED
jgi:F0F1-type ATP synthase membrane subunit b/b'